MGILDTFYFVFASDASSIKKGLAEGQKAGDDLGKKLEGVDKIADNLGKSFLDMAASAGKALVAIVALETIKSTIQNTADHTQAVNQQARALGISTEAMSLWQHAVVSVGGSAAEATASLANLHARFTELTAFGGQSFILNQLGLSGKDIQASIKDPTIALQKLAGVFGGMNNQQQLWLGKKLGLDLGTITLLSKGGDALASYLARQRELGVVTEGQAKQAEAYKLQLAELGVVYETIRRELTSDFLPALTWLFSKIEAVTLWFREHKVFAMAFFGGIAATLTLIYLPAVISAAIATWALIAPFVAVGVAIGALAALFALVTDDVWAFMHGQDSVIGRLSEKWPIVGEIVRNTVDGIIGAFKLVMAIGKGLYEAVTEGPTAAFQHFAATTDKIFDAFEARFPKLGSVIKAVASAIKIVVWALIDDFAIFNKAIGWIIESIAKLIAGITGLSFGFIGSLLRKLGVIPEDGAAAPGSAGLPVANTGPPATSGEKATGAQIAGKFEAFGWSPAQAAGMAGSIIQESGGAAGARNKSSGAYGLEQWLGPRVKDFEAFSGRPLEGSSLDEQIAFANYELTKGKEQAAGRRLRMAQTPEEAARIHSQYVERPGTAEANNGRRQQLASDILAARQQIDTANGPTSAMTSGVINNSRSSNRALSVQTGPVTVNAKSADGVGVGKDLGQGLQDHYRSTIDSFDDGVAA